MRVNVVLFALILSGKPTCKLKNELELCLVVHRRQVCFNGNSMVFNGYPFVMTYILTTWPVILGLDYAIRVSCQKSVTVKFETSSLCNISSLSAISTPASTQTGDIIDSVPPHHLKPRLNKEKHWKSVARRVRDSSTCVSPSVGFCFSCPDNHVWSLADKTMSAPASALWLSDAPDSFPPTYSPQIITMLKGFVGHSCTISLATNQPVSVMASRLLTPRVIIIFLSLWRIIYWEGNWL